MRFNIYFNSAKNKQAFVPPKPKEFFITSLLLPTLDIPTLVDSLTKLSSSLMPLSGFSKFTSPGIRPVSKDLQARAASSDPAALII